MVTNLYDFNYMRLELDYLFEDGYNLFFIDFNDEKINNDIDSK